jgi:hypothetical protein
MNPRFIVANQNPDWAAPFSTRRIATADTNAASVTTTPSRVYTIVTANKAAAARYLKLYDKATPPIVGTDTPKYTIPIPIGGQVLTFPLGLKFSLGIAWAQTVSMDDSAVDALTAGDTIVTLEWA